MNTDFSAVKNFVLPFREGMGLQFRAEFFNVFNHPQFGLTGDAAFGAHAKHCLSQALALVNQSRVNNPRVIQFALKLKF